MREKLMNVGLALILSGSVLLIPRIGFTAPPGQTQPTAGARAPVTNADVIRMLQAILGSIRSGPVKFDLSPTGLAALRQAGVSEPILNAMVQAQRQAQAQTPGKPPASGSAPAAGMVVAGKSRKLTPQQTNAILAKVRKAPGKSGPVVTNPAAGQANGALVALLRQQKQTALVQRSQAPPPVARAQGPVYGRAVAGRTPIRVAAPSSGNSLGSRAALGAQASVNVACATFTSPIIEAVSGQSGSAAVFTQDPQYNPFTIKGCNFGNNKGQAQLNYSNGRKLTDLTIDTWTDNLITVEVPPSLADVLDQASVTLVLFPASGPQASKPGFKFYAMRRELYLSSIPQSKVQLVPINDDSGSPVTPLYSSPYKDQWTNQYVGTSAGVDRINQVRFPAGTDVFDFANLKPGFVLEKYQVKELSVAGTVGVCGLIVEQDTDYTDGTWSWQIVGNTIRVSWQEAHAHIPCQDESDASYGLNVWVTGPALSSQGSPWQNPN